MVLLGAGLHAQTAALDWQREMREQVSQRQLEAALATVNRRIEQSAGDVEAHGWRGRILAWSGRWSDAESEYRYVLQEAPADAEIMAGLADVLLWQGRAREALGVLDRASQVSASDPEVLLRRAKVLLVLERDAEARSQFQQVLGIDPENQEARKALSKSDREARHEFRVGEDIDTFNYTDAAQGQSFSLSSRWSLRWSTYFSLNHYQRFGENAAKGTASIGLRIHGDSWLNAGGAGARDQGVIPRSEAFFELGHGFRFQNPFFRGLETAYQQHWFWYREAHVLAAGGSATVYLPRDWTWTLTVRGARSGFAGTGVEWTPSGSTRLGFPIWKAISGNLLFGVGSETYAQVDQIGSFSARTYGGGLRVRISRNQDITGYVASQQRSQGRSQNSLGLNYGIHF